MARPGVEGRPDAGGRRTPTVRRDPEVRWAGERALLLDCGDLDGVLQWHAHLTAHPLPGQAEVLAAARTVLVSFANPRAARKAADDVADLHPTATGRSGGRTVEIPVVYDGADLPEVARLTGMSEHAVVETHTGTAWTAAFGGFAPGFTYLTAPGDPLDVPRRDTPRTAVPAGSVALAGTFSAVYPHRSPGGWQLIGRTDAVLWDPNWDSPALVRPGDTVRYRAVRELVSHDDAARRDVPDGRSTAGSAPASACTPTPGPGSAPASEHPHRAHHLTVEDPGMQALVQDLGRAGLGDLGVPASGAADRVSAAQANRLVGNPASAAALELLLGGARFTARGHHALALAGATVGGRITGIRGHTRPVPFCEPFALYDGEQLVLDTPTAGLRTYLAVRGGIGVPAVLGSRSTDVLSSLGPDPLAAGDVLPVGTVPPGRAVGVREAPEVTPAASGEETVLRILPGPREDWFTPEALARVTGRTWRVGSASNRVGVRFETPEDGGLLERGRTGELASEGVVAGSLQVPHSGVPVLFLADHPVTGGYPVIAVVADEDLPLAGQLAPGSAVRFRLTDPSPPRNADLPEAMDAPAPQAPPPDRPGRDADPAHPHVPSGDTP